MTHHTSLLATQLPVPSIKLSCLGRGNLCPAGLLINISCPSLWSGGGIYPPPVYGKIFASASIFENLSYLSSSPPPEPTQCLAPTNKGEVGSCVASLPPFALLGWVGSQWSGPWCGASTKCTLQSSSTALPSIHS